MKETVNERNRKAEGGRGYTKSSNIVECTEQSRYCMKKFIPTRPGQTDVCHKCLEMLGELKPLVPGDKKRNLWN